MISQQRTQSFSINEIIYEKYEVYGNRFIIIDSRINNIDLFQMNSLAKHLCNQKLTRADNLIIIQNSDIAHFRVRFIAPDGSESDMCGNGIRSVALYYFNTYGIKQLNIEVNYGIVESVYYSNGIEINVGYIKDPRIYFGNGLKYEKIFENIYMTNLLGNEVFLLNIGEPHAVIIKRNNDINLMDFVNILNNKNYFNFGINLNLLEHLDSNILSNKTLERGLWNFTSNCSTGSICSSIIAKLILHLDYDDFIVKNRLGIQNVRITKNGIRSFSNAKKIFSGRFNLLNLQN